MNKESEELVEQLTKPCKFKWKRTRSSMSPLKSLLCLLLGSYYLVCSAQIGFINYDVLNAVPFKGSNKTNTGSGCVDSMFVPQLLECSLGAKLDDGFTGPVDSVFDNLTSFFAFSRESGRTGTLVYIFSSFIPLGSIHIVLYFFNSPNNSIGLPSVSLTTANLEPVAFTFDGNNDLSQADSTIRNVTLDLDSSTSQNLIDIFFIFENNSRIDWLLISEVEFFNSSLVHVLDPITFENGLYSIVSLGPERVQSNVSLSCTVINSGSFEWVWEYEGSELPTVGGCYQIWTADATRTSILEISGLRYTDSGNYTCRVRQQENTIQYSRTIQLRVIEAPSSSSSRSSSPPSTSISSTFTSSVSTFPMSSSLSSIPASTSTSSSLSFTFSSSPSSVYTLPTSSSSNELLVVALSSSIVVGIVLTVSMLTVILTMLVCYRKKRSSNISLKDLTMNQSYGVVADSACYVDIDAEIQKETEAMFSGSVIDKSRLDLIEKLGEGEFGVVYQGKLTGQSSNIPTAVAVKTLKGSVDPSKADSIINEALKMKSFNHLNVLPLIGVCLEPIEAPCIVMPFMNEGSLLSYLRREKHNLIVSAMAEEKTISETAKKLLSMCLQVANGMAYLSDMKFVHRDLAARNCMISSDGIIKVADFGLSEDIYESEYFKQPKESKEKVKLPLKWMAPESIHYRTFNEKTDVWSYGVVCWEVFTSGMSPYSNMSPKDVLDTLNAGQRLDKPSNAACSEEIYSLMLVCWNESASKRHCFHEIVNKLEHLIAPLSEYMDFTELYVTIRKEK